MLKPTAPTGVFPNGGDGDRWSYMRDGRVVWSGSYDECWRRYQVSVYTRPGFHQTDPDAIGRAIRAVDSAGQPSNVRLDHRPTVWV